MYPWRFAAVELTHSPLWILLHAWPGNINSFMIRDVAINVAIYIPAGIAGHLAFRRFRRMRLAMAAPVLICFLLSASIEMLQLWIPSRTTSLLDLTANTFGAFAGVLLAIVLEDFFPELRKGTTRKPIDRAAIALAGCWAMSILFPLIPIFGRTTFWRKVAIFRHTSVFDGVTLLSAAVAWFALGNLLQAGGLRSARRRVLLFVLSVPAQFFIVDRQPVPAQLLGAIAGAVCYALFWPRRREERDVYRKALAGVFLLTIVIRGLAPFVFSAAAAPLSWIPFIGLLDAVWQVATITVAGKFFWYGTAIWLFCGAGMRLRNSTAAVAATLLVIELVQTHIPGHVSEITDPILAIVAGWSILVLRQR